MLIYEIYIHSTSNVSKHFLKIDIFVIIYSNIHNNIFFENNSLILITVTGSKELLLKKHCYEYLIK